MELESSVDGEAPAPAQRARKASLGVAAPDVRFPRTADVWIRRLDDGGLRSYLEQLATTSARVPIPATSAGTSPTRPSPKSIRAGAANSKFTAGAPRAPVREYVRMSDGPSATTRTRGP